MRLIITTCLILLTSLLDLSAQDQGEDCCNCPLPNEFIGSEDNAQAERLKMEVHLSDGTILYNCCSATRVLIQSVGGGYQQGLRLGMVFDEVCTDTIVPVQKVKYFRSVSMGAGGTPVVVSPLPVREYYSEEIEKLKDNFLEISGVFGLTGSDESTQEVGADSYYISGEAIVSPFGSALGQGWFFGVGAGALMERDRLRVPIIFHLRWSFWDNKKLVDRTEFVPDPCRFEYNSDNIISAPSGISIVEKSSYDEVDSSSYVLTEKKVSYSWFRPYIFVEGGPVIGGEGDADELVNPDDEDFQYFFGAGIGMPLFETINVALGYRMLQLNVFTPCPACNNKAIVNNNTINSFFLKVGIPFEW